ncbi:MAG: large subunit ribosomal protein L10 [Parcubacteria group bacterium Gr01-1014_33]|nr:MAG: large subunit ribosomal protein L10 [Parcubacteria group bacterium Gr01-1014_33]
MLHKAQKLKIIEDLAERFKKQKIAIFTDFHGTSVAKAQILRRVLKKSEAEYKVAKKTLLDRALQDAGIAFQPKELQGEVGVTFGYGDQAAPAKDLVKFRKENESFKILAGILEGKLLSEKDVIALAKLPPREVLLAHVLGAMQSPIRGLAVVLQGNIKNLVVVINKIKDQRAVH